MSNTPDDIREVAVETEVAEITEVAEVATVAEPVEEKPAKKAKKVKEPKMRKELIPYERKKRIVGWAFMIHWIIGMFAIFLYPLFQSLYYSIMKMTFETVEGVSKTIFQPVGLKHYFDLFISNAEFLPQLTTTLKNMIYQVPVIVIFSLFMAIMLNQKFLGRLIVRATFFLPVIVASGVVISIMQGDQLQQALRSQSSVNTLFSTTFMDTLLREANMGSELINIVTGTVDSMFNLIWKSGIQILIFLAGLQTISTSMYEAAKMEGATAWEIFWKITFPMISPMTILNLVYTIIDTFRDYSNPIIKMISDASSNLQIEQSMAMSWTYFLMVGAIIAIVYAIINKFVFYQV